eukprot:768587-Hanusia_phi.AAC.2
MEIFSERCLMHDKVYQNRRVLAIEEMIFDILISGLSSFMLASITVPTGHDDTKIAVFAEDGALVRHCTMCEAALDPQVKTSEYDQKFLSCQLCRMSCQSNMWRHQSI